jgi:hypothetical protein
MTQCLRFTLKYPTKDEKAGGGECDESQALLRNVRDPPLLSKREKSNH